MSRLLRAAGMIGLVTVLSAALVTPCLAQLSAPDTLEIVEVQVFRNLAQPDDILYVVRYDIDWGNVTTPVEAVDRTFDFLLYDDAGVVVGNTTATVFHNKGYNQGIVSWYFDGNSSNPEWEELGNVTVMGTSLFAGSPPSDTYNITADDYSIYESPADTREDLRQFIIAQTLFLDYDWNDYFIGGGAESRELDLLYYLADAHTYVLSPTGEAYYAEAIPGLVDYVPVLLLFNLSEWTYSEKEHSLTGKTTFESQWEGTPVEDFRQAVSGMMGSVGATTAFTMLVVLLFLFNMGWTSYKYNRLYPGIMAATGTALIIARMGLPDIAMVMTVVMAAVLFALYGLLLKPGQG